MKKVKNTRWRKKKIRLFFQVLIAVFGVGVIGLWICAGIMRAGNQGGRKDKGVQMVVFDDILVQKCDENTKTIEFVSNEGNYCEPVIGKPGQTIELPTPTRDLYKFEGWYTDVELKKAFKKNKMPSDLTTRLYAKWSIAEDAISVTLSGMVRCGKCGGKMTRKVKSTKSGK